MALKQCYGSPPPGLDPSKLTGALVVIEGPDSSGRSTHIQLLAQWLEQNGYPVAQVGLKRSQLVGRELERAKQGNVLSPRTMSLFYATDFYDQLENIIVPALRAGSVVLADRYIFTLMARDLVRGADRQWLAALYAKALVPDIVFLFEVSAQTLVDRTLYSHGRLDYWESGMDVGLSSDWFGSFIRYQRKIRMEFKELQKHYSVESVNANRTVATIQKDLKVRVQAVLQRVYPLNSVSVRNERTSDEETQGSETEGAVA
jgi:dTMP kinase